MIEQATTISNTHEFDRGLWHMVLVSGALHAAVIALVLLLPYSAMRRAQPLTSYTVDLVAADKVGGTNLVPGGKGRVEGPPLVAARPVPNVEPPKPAPPKIEQPPEEAKPAEAAKPAAPKSEPQKADVQPPKEVASKPEPPPPVEVKPADVPKPPEAKPKEAKPREEALTAKKVEKVEPPAPKPAAAPKAVAKAEPPAAKTESAKGAPTAASKADAAAAKKAAAEAAAAHERDERILAAVKRVEQTGVRGGGTGQKPGDKPGGSVSVGPGQGAGGQFMGLEYILYYNALRTRLRDNWAWAGTDAKLEAVIHFGITESGDVVGVRITQSSGDASFDHSVERAVKALNPMPPPPEAHRKEFADVEWTFNLQEMHE